MVKTPIPDSSFLPRWRHRPARAAPAGGRLRPKLPCNRAKLASVTRRPLSPKVAPLLGAFELGSGTLGNAQHQNRTGLMTAPGPHGGGCRGGKRGPQPREATRTTSTNTLGAGNRGQRFASGRRAPPCQSISPEKGFFRGPGLSRKTWPWTNCENTVNDHEASRAP